MMQDFHLHAHKYIGVKFHHRGRTVNRMDCVGLVIRCAKDCGYDKYEEFAYGGQPRNNILQGVLEEHFGTAKDRPPKINDVLLLRLRPEAEPTHVAIVTHYPHETELGIIHTHSMLRRVTYQRLTDKFRSAIAGVYQWPDMH